MLLPIKPTVTKHDYVNYNLKCIEAKVLNGTIVFWKKQVKLTNNNLKYTQTKVNWLGHISFKWQRMIM